MFSIRPYHSDDIKPITEIYSFHVLNGTASFEVEAPSSDEMRARMNSLLDANYPIFVATDETQQIVGYGYAGAHKARYAYRLTVEDSVYVHHLHHQKGIGSALLNALITHCMEDGYHQMIAVIGDAANLGSVKLHTKAGFKMVGTAPHLGFKFGRFIDVVFMQRQLNPEQDFISQ